MTKLPPPIMTSEKGSFARKTIEELKPGIIDNILSVYDYTPQIRKTLLELKNEMKNGLISQLLENTSDKTIWDEDTRLYRGKSWLEIPWFLAETFFFRRVLQAVQYFQPGPWQGKDPFQHLKTKEISNALQPFIDAYQPEPSKNNLKSFQIACYQALWGNQSDLSNLEIYETTRTSEMNKFVFDQTGAAFEYLNTCRPTKIAYFLDNVGKELYFDLALIDYFLQIKLADSITCYLKNQPFFVSDAQPKDFLKAIDYLASSSVEKCQRLADRITNWTKSGVINVEAPPFLTTSRSFREMPEALKKQLGGHDITILKGDVNYRRLVGDRHWDPTTPLEGAAGYFFTTFISLRTLKSELIVGMSAEKMKTLEAQAEEDWLINGKRGMVIFAEK
jgi:hypothetical protein